MIILGIDPGFERLGIAVLEKSAGKNSVDKTQNKEKVLFSECFKTSPNIPFPERLMLIGEEIRNVIKKFKPDILAIETLFLTTNQKTVMHVAEVRGVAIYEASLAGLKIFEASPPQIKVATTGYGKASKEQIIKMVKILVTIKNPQGPLTLKKESDDELDAIAIALTASAYARF